MQWKYPGKMLTLNLSIFLMVYTESYDLQTRHLVLHHFSWLTLDTLECANKTIVPVEV